MQLNSIKNLLGLEVRYLYGAATKKEDENKFPYAWHRDNVCRLFGIGPDWNEKENYNVLRVGIYLSSQDIVKSGLNIIPFSHKRRYTFSNLLRLLHYKTKSSNNLLITFHPITNNINLTYKYLNEILRALEDFKNTMIVFTYPNNDEGSQEIINMLK